MIENTISTHKARRFYDLVGKRYDWFEFFESRAKERSLNLLNLEPGLNLLNVGIGTGKDHARIAQLLHPGGVAHGLDISPVMLVLARNRGPFPLYQADVHYLPCAPGSFDRLYAAYLLDLIPLADIPGILRQFNRVLRPGGQMVVLTLTEGAGPISRAVLGAWKMVYALSPALCGGCRPLELVHLIAQAGFNLLSREVVVQMAVPSEIVCAQKAVRST